MVGHIWVVCDAQCLCQFQLKAARNAAKLESTEDQLSDLTKKIEQCQTEMTSAQSEVDRLLEILKESESEKTEKESQIKELQE